MVKKILILADDPEARDMLVRAFTGSSFQTFVVPTAESALFQFALTQPDLVILDLSLSGTAGWEALQRIRQLSSVPVIALTTLDDIGVVVASLEGGADDVVTRPFDVRELEARVRALLRRVQTVAQARRLSSKTPSGALRSPQGGGSSAPPGY